MTCLHPTVAKDLITHLLCVDPAQRYTIDEFLAHPWITAAPAPPQATPFSRLRAPLDSPLLADARGGAREARSPGVAQLKEAFDVTYAVHRMEEEGARKRAQKGGANRGFLNNLNEDDEEEELPPSMSRSRQQQTAGQAGIGAGAKAAAKRGALKIAKTSSQIWTDLPQPRARASGVNLLSHRPPPSVLRSRLRRLARCGARPRAPENIKNMSHYKVVLFMHCARAGSTDPTIY